jgi:hypothetical protein
MVRRLDTGDEVAYGHNCQGITRLLFLKDYKGCIEGERRRHALEVASVRQVIGRHGPLATFLDCGVPLDATSRSSAQYIKDHHERFSTHCICR